MIDLREVIKIFGNMFDDVINIIEDWKPNEDYPNENNYRDDLMKFLRNELNKPNSLALGQPERITIKKDAGRGYCDIVVDNRIGIELKKDLRRKKDVDRLSGQLLDYKKEYEDIIIVLVGETNDEWLDKLYDKIDDIKGEQGIGLMSQNPRIEVIDKGFKDNDEDDKCNSEKEGYWF